jgi:hypothetical protein
MHDSIENTIERIHGQTRRFIEQSKSVFRDLEAKCPVWGARETRELVDLVRSIRADLDPIKNLDPELAKLLSAKESELCTLAYSLHQTAVAGIKGEAIKFSTLVHDDLGRRGLLRSEKVDTESGVIDFQDRRMETARDAAQVDALGDAIQVLLRAWRLPYFRPVAPEDVPSFEERERYTAPRKFADLDIEVQALVKVLADHLMMNCLHPQTDPDVERILKDAVMAIVRPPPGAPKEMSGNEAYAAQLRVQLGYNEEEIAAELAEFGDDKPVDSPEGRS